LVSIPKPPAKGYSAYPAISRDGTRVAYTAVDISLYPGVPYYCEMYTVGTGVHQVLSDPILGGTIGQVALSRDGTRVVFPSGTFNMPQHEIWIEGLGIQRLTRSTSGRTTKVGTDSPAISGDGRWASWAGAATMFVPNDTNGLSDVFIRGPY
jgi:hypothetical protein